MSDSSEKQQEDRRQEAKLLWGRGFEIAKEGRHQTAIEILLRARDADPTYYWPWVSLGTSYAELGEHELAIECFEASLKLELPENRFRARVASCLGHALRGAGKHREAEEYYRVSAETDPRPSAFALLGGLYVHLERHDEAEQVLRRVLELDPDYDEAMGNLAIVLRRTGRIDEAVEMARRAIDVDPNCAMYHRELGLLMRMKGHYEQSEVLFRKSLELDGTEYWARAYLADLMYCQERYQEAIEQWHLAAQAAPDYSGPYRCLGVLYEDLGQHYDAEQAYRRATEIEPDNPAALFQLGTMLFKLGKKEEAKPHLRKFLALSPQDKDAPYVRRLLGHDPGE